MASFRLRSIEPHTRVCALELFRGNSYGTKLSGQWLPSVRKPGAKLGEAHRVDRQLQYQSATPFIHIVIR
jgi:hypothetical protein